MQEADGLAAAARTWYTAAMEDISYAELGLCAVGPVPYKLVAFHAQQAAEKGLKAFLVSRNVDFPYTHNIRLLLNLCSDHAEWVERLRDTESLTPFAVALRYPGIGREVAAEEARTAVRLAREVLDAVGKALDEPAP
ncbi:MAG: HEPN domain protein [Candidatus Latescibacteria bacterium ADurb.Bin168]|nr:MAG: HEPN domain protein [Candidatus Latescibacteria bacterium ADurb.Bin168]